tara:strand:- start:104 stop:802 length:699 start_codon:yes stop_codon:yes gene_type:complete
MVSQDKNQTDAPELEPEHSHDQEQRLLERILGLKQAIKDGLGGPVELHELGICYFMLRNFRQSSKFLNELIETYADYVEIAAVMALQVLCLIEDEEYAAAEEILSKRLAKFGNDVRLLSMQAHIYDRTGRAQQSIATHRRILELDPDNVNSLNSLGYLLALHGKSDAEREEAFRSLKQVISQKPDHPAYLDSFGVFLAKQGNQAQARKALFKALQRAPDNQEILDHIREFLD